MEPLQAEPRLERDVIGGAEPGVGGTKPLAGGGRIALGRGEPVAVRGVGRVDLDQRRARGGLIGRACRDLGPQRVAFLGQRPFALAQ